MANQSVNQNGAQPQDHTTPQSNGTSPHEAGNRAILWLLLDRHENATELLKWVTGNDFPAGAQRLIIEAAARCKKPLKPTLDQIEDELLTEAAKVTDPESSAAYQEAIFLKEELIREKYSPEIEELKNRRIDEIRAAKKQASPEIPAPTVETKTAQSQEDGLIKKLADVILAEDFIAKDAGGKAYVFQCGVYIESGEKFIKCRVKHYLLEWGLSKKWSSNRANEVVKYILVDCPTLWPKPPLDTLNLKNGLLDILTRELRPHSPEFLSTVQLPVSYSEDARCLQTERFINSTYPKDATKVAWQIRAWLMLPDTSIQKSILALGEGSNGKSTELRAQSAFIGAGNIANLSLQSMEGNRFAVSRLGGKLANICPDLPSAHLADTGIFKAVTGGDPITAEYKYGEPFSITPFARLVFSANQAPKSNDATHAFFRRWLVIPFNNTFEGVKAVSSEVLDALLSSPEELSGVLNKALDALPELRKNSFDESTSMKEAWNELRQTTDPLAVWLDTATVEGPEAFVTKRALCQSYNAAGKVSGHTHMTENAFGRALRRHRPNLADGQKTIGGKVLWVWQGIGLYDDKASF